MISRIKEKVRRLFGPANGTTPKGPVYPVEPECLHIEVSYTCNLHCMMCPRKFEGVPQEVMPPELFERVRPYLERFPYVHLTGYGEPLMSPHFVDFIKAVRQAGSRPVVTTNGLLLKGKLARRILEERIDCISVSIDAGTPETYEQVRGKGTFLRLLETLRQFEALRREIHPGVYMVWVFILMRSNYKELPLALEFAKELGFNRFIAKHLECALTQEGFSEALFDTGYVPPPEPELIEDLERVLAECRGLAGERIEFLAHPFQMQVDGMCLVKPVTNVVVDYRGNVSNCCYLMDLETKPYMDPPPEDHGVMGNLYRQSLDEILQSPRHIQFQQDWMEGRVPKICEGCVQLARMKEQNLLQLPVERV
jgi:MoaA/NifB/PqqE/SkfB family radical SAM enzyme